MDQFCCIWFESRQQWFVLFEDGSLLDGFPSIGHAANAAYSHLRLGESDFDVTEDTGTFYRYERTQ